jgi:predicted nucleotidyltransferase
LSQTELALRARVAQSVVSAYENGHREPSLPTLRHLVEATGQQLSIEIRSDRAPVGLPDTPRGHLLRRRRAEIHRIADRYGVSSLRVFGSVASGDDGPESDIDIAAELPSTISLIGLAGLRRELSDLLGVPVDVVPTSGLRRAVAADLDREGVSL